jgi:hypothetical protein
MTKECYKFDFLTDETVTTREFKFLMEDKTAVSGDEYETKCVCVKIKDDYKTELGRYLPYDGLTEDSVFDVIVALDSSGAVKKGKTDIVALPCPPFCSKGDYPYAISLCSGSAKLAPGIIKNIERIIKIEMEKLKELIDRSEK